MERYRAWHEPSLSEMGDALQTNSSVFHFNSHQGKHYFPLINVLLCQLIPEKAQGLLEAY